MSKNSLHISRIVHAGYALECARAQILFDPIFENPFSRNCHAFPNVEFDVEQIRCLKPAAVFISHHHDDHCSLNSLALLDKSTPIYLYCTHELLFGWIRELGFKTVLPLTIDAPIQVGPFTVIPRKAWDADVDCLLHIKAAGLNILNVVDSLIDPVTLPELARQGPWDMILWPFQTLREIAVLSPARAPAVPRELPPEWIEEMLALKPRFIVPSSCQFIHESWSWYNHAMFPITYAQFKNEVVRALPGTQVVRLNPSVTIELSADTLKVSAPLEWVRPKGTQDVDYEYRADGEVPTTAEISRRLPSLTSSQLEDVYEYCTSGLLKRYQSLEPSPEPYFAKPRIWRLSLYAAGAVIYQFHYRLSPSRIERVADHEGPIAWTTEVPAVKLHAALFEGESLTSMYMRINDLVFESAIENQIVSADVVEDPLIRCLFSGIFGAYQAAQLKLLNGG